MVQSFDAAHPLAKYSSGEVLFSTLLAEDVEKGAGQLDFGVGDARYKKSWSNATTTMFDLTFAPTAVGRAYAMIEAARSSLLRSIKQNEWLYAGLKTFRAGVGRLKRRG